MKRLKAGLSKTSTGLTTLFVGARIDEDLYEELEAALLMADAGVEATQFLLNGLKRRGQGTKAHRRVASQDRAARPDGRDAHARCKNRWCWAASSRWSS